MKIKILLLFISIFLSSCIGTKYLKKDETILYKQNIKSEGPVNEESLRTQLIQTPNSRLLSLPIAHLVHVYKWGESNLDSAKLLSKKERTILKYDKKIADAKSYSRKTKLTSKKIQKTEKIEKTLREGNQLMRWGEQLTVFDSTQLVSSRLNLRNYLFSKGYFKAEISTKVTHRNQRTFVTYHILESKPYTIDSIVYKIQDKQVKKLFEANINQQKMVGKQYDQELFGKERDRVYDLMSNNGYYDFKKQYILFEVDSTQLDDRKLLIRENIANPPGKVQHRTFRMDSVIFSNETAFSNSQEKQTKEYNQITYSFINDKYPERLLSWRIFLEKDSLYSKQNTLETQKQLSYLDIFKFVNINYDSSGGQFIANIFTSPLKKYQTSTDMGLSVLEHAQGPPGPFFNFNAKSRNVFGGLEIIQLDGNASIQGIKSVSEDNTNYSRFQYGGQLSVTFPQFLFPMRESQRAAIGRYNPRTKIATGVNFEDRKDEYKRTTFNGSMSYIWQVKESTQFTLKPFDLSYINSQNSPSFADTLKALEESGNQSLVSSFQSSFVSFTSFSTQFNQNNYGLGGRTNSGLWQGYIETGGNLQSILGKEPLSNSFDSLEYYHYVKVGVDVRRTNRLSSKSSLAYRLNLGMAYAYGGNKALPYEKYFFAGGSNSIRAWQPRRLGPGAYAVYSTSDNGADILVNNSREQPGDIILEASVEFRRDLVGFIDYALFIDAGNIWLWNSETVEKETDGYGTGTNDDGIFRFNTFPKEIAVGAGFGLRFDFSFLVLRTDVAYKMIDPAYPIGQRFVLGDYRLNDLWDFQNRAAVNIGIGYPF
ncbi:BamA/TamA family outer membrane protein [Marinoscillum sp.]|uniref:translocation and assembly module lipoprotein TamL n=1 Tax=Marinoscillum sp. TaxID=2024838 RepID=UPI003BAC0AA2